MHVYPHERLPLVPTVLLPALQEFTVEIEPHGSVGVRLLTQAGYCQSLTPKQRIAAAQAISTLVQKVCYGRVHRRGWANCRIQVPKGVKLGDLVLTDRALVSLQRHDFFGADDAWRTCTIGELMGERGAHRFGSRLLLAFLLAAEAAQDSTNDAAARETSSRTLEGELAQLITSKIHSPRTASVYLDMNGWGGRGRKGLATLAEEAGLTHERVRQIGLAGSRAMESVDTATNELATTAKTLAMLDEMAPCLLGYANAMLRIRGLTHQEFCASDLLKAAERFGLPSRLSMARIDGQDIIARPGDVAIITDCRHLVRKALRASGILDVEALRRDCDSMLGGRSVGGDRERVIDIAMSTMPGWAFLDNDKLWATVVIGSDGEELHPKGPAARIARMACYYGGVALREALRVLEQHRIDWPAHILLALCLRVGLRVTPLADDWWIEVSGAVATRVRRSLEATAEHAIAGIIMANGGALDRSRLLQLCEQSGIHRSTALACLKTASLFLCTPDGGCALSVMRAGAEARPVEA